MLIGEVKITIFVLNFFIVAFNNHSTVDVDIDIDVNLMYKIITIESSNGREWPALTLGIHHLTLKTSKRTSSN
jgi:hypothetical protein